MAEDQSIGGLRRGIRGRDILTGGSTARQSQEPSQGQQQLEQLHLRKINEGMKKAEERERITESQARQVLWVGN